MILIVSDLHLGSVGTDWQQFESFLEEIQNCKDTQQGRFANTTTLLLLGDIFDLLRDRLGDISQEYKDTIFRRLESLNNLPDFHVIYFVGNHDIYLEKFDREGQRTETEIIDPVGFQFYEEQCFTALLRNVNGNWQLKLYDEKPAGFWKRIKRFLRRIIRIGYNPEAYKQLKYDTTFTLGQSTAGEDFLCILCHGYQYEFLDSLVKEASLLLSKIPVGEYEILRKLMDSLERPLVNMRKFFKKHSFNWIPLERKTIHQAFDSAPFSSQIDSITHAILGHTHLVDPTPTTPPEPAKKTVDGLTVVNTGCWLMTTPSYVIIHDDGSITTHFYEMS